MIVTDHSAVKLYWREFTKVLYSAVADFRTLPYRKLRSAVFTVRHFPERGKLHLE